MALLDSLDVLHSSTSLQHVPPPLSFDSTPRQRRTTTPSRHTPRPPSPRRRAATDLVQSRSVTDLRTRNDLKMSTSSLTEQLPSLTSDLSNRPSSRDTRSSGLSQWREDRPDGLARSLLTKSSRLLMRRKGSKLGLSSVRTLEWLEDTEDVTTKHVQELSKRRKSKHSRTESVGYEYMLKHSISDPYNFRHLTHTGAQQAKALQNASQDDLVTEFSAIRASQAPRPELKGIKADQLIPKKRFMWIDSPSPISASPPMSSLSPTRSRDQWGEASCPNGNENLRYTKSIDSFTRLTSGSFSSPMPPLSPPPHGSSRMATNVLQSHPSALQESPTAPTFDVNSQSRSSSVYSDPHSPSRNPVAIDEDNSYFDPSTIAQAMTTPDDTAFILGAYAESSPSIGLADVPEEDEVNARGGHLVTESRPPTSTSIRHTKSFPSVEISPKRYGHYLPRTQSDTQMCAHSGWGVVSDPTLPLPHEHVEEVPVQPRLPHRISTGVKALDASWEDDIDYCYEHAAEADSAFDWDKVSRDEGKECVNDSQDHICDDPLNLGYLTKLPLTDIFHNPPSHPIQSERFLPYGLASVAPHPSTIFGSQSSPSASLSATLMPSIASPGESTFRSQDVTVSRTSSGSIMFPLSPSLLIPSEYASRTTHEETFHRRLADRDSSIFQDLASNGKNFDLPGQDYYTATSTALPACDWNSQNSSFTDGLLSDDSLLPNSDSIASLPDLVPSRVHSDKVMFAAESLADHISLLNIAKNPAKLGMIVDATRRMFIREATSTESVGEEEAPIILPVVKPRQGASSDSLNQSPDPTGSKLLDAFSATRTRSSSVATTLSGKSKSSRASYSLFPTMAASR